MANAGIHGLFCTYVMCVCAHACVCLHACVRVCVYVPTHHIIITLQLCNNKLLRSSTHQMVKWFRSVPMKHQTFQPIHISKIIKFCIALNPLFYKIAL